MYLNHGKIAASKAINGFIIGGCGLMTFINVMFMSAPFSNRLGMNRVAALMLFAFFLMIASGCAAVIFWRIMALRRVSRCRIYNSLLEEDHDGIITYDSIASMTGFKVPNVIKDLVWFIDHGYMVNVTLGREACRVDLLSGETEFVTVSCPSCGAVVSIRKGGGGRCHHCGTFMRLAEDQNVQK